MKKSIPAFLALALGMALPLMAQNFQWAKRISGANSERVHSVVRDGQGNVIVVGEFYATPDFDPGPGVYQMTSTGQGDVFVVKLDAVGNFLWAAQVGGASYDYCNDVAVDGSGNILLTGSFYSTIDCDPGPGNLSLTSVGITDAFVIKLDPSGALLWARQLGGGDNETAHAIATDDLGAVYTTGSFIGTCDFDPGPMTANVTATGTIQDVYISKLDASGNYVWAKKMGGAWSDFGYSIAVSTTYEVFVGGQFEGTADFDPGAGTYNLVTIGYQPDPFVAKLDASGNFLWAKGFGNSQGEGSRSMALDASNNVYLAGTFGSTVDFDPGAGTANLTSNGPYDLFLLKLTTAGTYVWAKQIGGSGYQEFERGLTVNATGVWMSGYFNGTMDMNPGAPTNNINSVGTQDGFLLNLDLNGAFVSVKQWGASGCTINPRGVAADNAGNVLMAGGFNDTLDFNPGAGVSTMMAAGSNDGFVVKFSTCAATSGSASANACGSYTLGGQTFTSSGSYQVILPNRLGCDSVVTLSLTVRQPSTHTINHVSCGSTYTLNGQTYTQSGTFTQTLTNSVGCDSVITLNLSLQQNSASTLNHSTCTGTYTLNGQTYTQAGTYTQTLTNVSGCDSIITLHLTLGTSNAATISATACDSYTLNGQTYTQSGSYTQVLTNVSGCDSTLTLQLALGQNTASTVNASGCDSYVLNGQTYTQSGTFTQTLVNSQGCDSVLTLVLTLGHSSGTTIAASGCDSYVLNGQTYTQSGTYTQVLTNGEGCDSTISLQLTLGHASSGSLTVSACDSYTLNGQTYTQAGTHVQTLTNTSGCDSTLTLNLSLGTTPTATITQNGTTLAASPSGMAYQWVICGTGQAIPGATGATFTPLSSGSYAVVVTDGDCADTSSCAAVIINGLGEDMPEGVRLYPNPTQGAVVLEWPAGWGEGEITVTNALGQVVARLPFAGGEVRKAWALQGPAGLYGVQITCDAGRFGAILRKD